MVNNVPTISKKMQLKWLNYGYRLGRDSLKNNPKGDKKMSEINKKELIMEPVDGTDFIQYYLKKTQTNNRIIGICIGVILTIIIMALFKIATT